MFNLLLVNCLVSNLFIIEWKTKNHGRFSNVTCCDTLSYREVMSMRLYLVQNGEAKSEAEDPERSMTIRGEEETKKISGTAKRLGIRPSRIYHSGKKGVCGDEGTKAVMFRYSAILCLEKQESGRWAVDWVIKPEMV